MLVTKHAATGVALILTDQNGENCIALAGGANDELGADMIHLAREDILNSSLLICQLEVPLGAVERAVSIAKENKVSVLLNPAPAKPLSDALLSLVDFLVLNEHELASISLHQKTNEAPHGRTPFVVGGKPSFGRGGRFGSCEIEKVRYGLERVVDLVRDAGGESSGDGELLGAANL